MIYKNLILLVIIAFSGLLLPSCAKKEASVLKIYARTSDNVLTQDVMVRIVGDIDKETPEYLGEVKTDNSGVAIFNLDEFFDQYGKEEEKVAYFTIYARDTLHFYNVGKTRVKANLTSTETIILKN